MNIRERKFVRKPWEGTFVQYDGSSDMAKALAETYVGLWEECGCLFMNDEDHFQNEVYEDDWLQIEDERVIDVIEPLAFKRMYEEVR